MGVRGRPSLSLSTWREYAVAGGAHQGLEARRSRTQAYPGPRACLTPLALKWPGKERAQTRHRSLLFHNSTVCAFKVFQAGQAAARAPTATGRHLGCRTSRAQGPRTPTLHRPSAWPDKRPDVVQEK